MMMHAKLAAKEMKKGSRILLYVVFACMYVCMYVKRWRSEE